VRSLKSSTEGCTQTCYHANVLDKLYEYLKSVSVREPAILRRLREETASHPMGGMQIPPEHGQFLALLIQLMGARRTLEVGVFTGYSSLAVALALPLDGTILACDVSEEYTSVARRYWKEAGVDPMIDLRIRPALETLKELLADGRQRSFDFAFIDADKANYEGYYECALELIRPGGLIAIDNVLWHGAVIDDDANDADTVAIRALNKKLLGDSRVSLSMVPISDGLTLLLKR
jgi:predicted O-methyltransferase YrrM